MATRPRAEQIGSHGLFGSEEHVDLNAVMDELSKHDGNAWTIIYSLRREDAIRLGYDNANSWRSLLLRNSTRLSECLKISPEELHWYAAFHDEGNHPHIHVMAWADNERAFLSKDHLLQMRSIMTNDIFKDELVNLYQRKDLSYKELVQEARKEMREMVFQMQSASCSTELEEKLLALSSALEAVGGKHQYGYLPKRVKSMVDDVVDELENIPEVKAAYAAWNGIRDELEQYYKDNLCQHLPLRQQKEFKAIKNIIIKEADALRMSPQQTVEQSGAEPEAVETDLQETRLTENQHKAQEIFNQRAAQSCISLLYHMSNIFREKAVASGNPVGVRADSRRRRRLQEKRLALGHKMDDHEEQISYQQRM